jgi:hypothetical protein
VFEHRQVLEGAGNAKTRKRMRRQFCEIASVKKDLAGRRPKYRALIRLNSVVLPAPFGPIRLQI